MGRLERRQNLGTWVLGNYREELGTGVRSKVFEYDGKVTILQGKVRVVTVMVGLFYS